MSPRNSAASETRRCVGSSGRPHPSHPMKIAHRCRLILALPAFISGYVPTLVAQADPTPKQPKPMLTSTVFKWEDLRARPTPNGERRDVADNPTPTLATFECHITTLN